jgi:hypothetical protein
MAMTKEQQLIRIKNEWRAAHGNAYAPLRTMLEWAHEQGKWKLDVNKAWARAVDEFADALRGEMTKDSQGREIRVNLPFLDPQTELWQWDQRDTISHGHMQLRVTHHWRMSFSDIRADVLSINDYHELHPDRPQLQYSLDFKGALLDDGITVPSSIELEPLAVPLHPGLADSDEQPEPHRPSSPRVSHVSPLRGSSRTARRVAESSDAPR